MAWRRDKEGLSGGNAYERARGRYNEPEVFRSFDVAKPVGRSLVIQSGVGTKEPGSRRLIPIATTKPTHILKIWVGYARKFGRRFLYEGDFPSEGFHPITDVFGPA